MYDLPDPCFPNYLLVYSLESYNIVVICVLHTLLLKALVSSKCMYVYFSDNFTVSLFRIYVYLVHKNPLVVVVVLQVFVLLLQNVLLFIKHNMYTTNSYCKTFPPPLDECTTETITYLLVTLNNTLTIIINAKSLYNS